MSQRDGASSTVAPRPYNNPQPKKEKKSESVLVIVLLVTETRGWKQCNDRSSSLFPKVWRDDEQEDVVLVTTEKGIKLVFIIEQVRYFRVLSLLAGTKDFNDCFASFLVSSGGT